jgi:catechol 2,3-dioxygenase-like lactoylglutathione lyase family enzyme
MPTVQVRYIVHDIDAAIDFYVRHLGFKLDMRPAPPFAMLSRADLRLALNAPGSTGGGGQPMSDGTRQEPGGWNRFGIQVDDIESTVAKLRDAGVSFRSDIITGVGNKQVLLNDPFGNPVELFQPLIEQARLS